MRAGTGRVSVLPVDNVERIEVVRGPGSVIYGGSAMGGVINIITSRGKGETSGSVGAEVGSFGHTEAQPPFLAGLAMMCWDTLLLVITNGKVVMSLVEGIKLKIPR